MFASPAEAGFGLGDVIGGGKSGGQVDVEGLTDRQYLNRCILRDAMMRHGFAPITEEWWHFRLNKEPYPNTYFTFPVR